MNRHLIDYSALPYEALGTPMRPEPAKPQDGPWKPLSPGYESRTLAGGAVEVRSTGVSAQDLKGYVEPAKKADESIITPLVPSAGVVAGGIPEGATHRNIVNGMLYRRAGSEIQYWLTVGRWCAGNWRLDCLDRSPFEPLRQQPADAPTEWQDGAPSGRGWFFAQDEYDRSHALDSFARYWSGSAWGSSVAQITDACVKIAAACAEASPRHLGIDVDIRWRGPRLVGAEWPEPQA